MATKIRAVKCPNCGSEKHDQLDSKRFRCKNCGTEFFIDDDDININVNHRYDYSPPPIPNLNGPSKLINLFAIAAVSIVTIIVVFGSMLFRHSSSSPSSLLNEDTTVEVDEDYKYIFPMSRGENVCFFYLTRRCYDSDVANKGKYIDGYYYGFRDAQSGKILSDHLLISSEDANKLNGFSFNSDNIRYFHQVGRWYIIVSPRYIYEIDPVSLTLKDVTKSLFAKKTAMNTGLSQVEFIRENAGEGFLVTNNMADTYYYFPGTDRLYTKEAFEYARTLPPSALQSEVRDSVYYWLQRTENKKKNRLWKLHVKFHLGDPQDSYYFPEDMSCVWDSDHRLINYAPISDTFVAFHTAIIYQDANYILLTYTPAIAEDANTVFQLRRTDGQILWTKPLEERLRVGPAARNNKKIWVRVETTYRDKSNDAYCYSFDLADGKYENLYVFPTEYKLSTK